jgi:hypothetical protein
MERLGYIKHPETGRYLRRLADWEIALKRLADYWLELDISQLIGADPWLVLLSPDPPAGIVDALRAAAKHPKNARTADSLLAAANFCLHLSELKKKPVALPWEPGLVEVCQDLHYREIWLAIFRRNSGNMDRVRAEGAATFGFLKQNPNLYKLCLDGYYQAKNEFNQGRPG